MTADNVIAASSSDSDSEGPAKRAAKKAQGRRQNKNQPQEVTSKRPTSRRRQVLAVPKIERRDPRFSTLSGSFNRDLFEKSYAFVDELKAQERADLVKTVERLTAEEAKLRGQPRRAAQLEEVAAERARIQGALGSMASREQAAKRQREETDIKRLWRKTEREALESGAKKRPFYLKRGDLKKLTLLARADGLKDDQLERAIGKRRKRNAARDRRFMPQSA